MQDEESRRTMVEDEVRLDHDATTPRTRRARGPRGGRAMVDDARAAMTRVFRTRSRGLVAEFGR